VHKTFCVNCVPEGCQIIDSEVRHHSPSHASFEFKLEFLFLWGHWSLWVTMIRPQASKERRGKHERGLTPLQFFLLFLGRWSLHFFCFIAFFIPQNYDPLDVKREKLISQDGMVPLKSLNSDHSKFNCNSTWSLTWLMASDTDKPYLRGGDLWAESVSFPIL